MTRRQSLVNKLDNILGLERKIVGVKFLFTKEDFDKINTPQVKNKMSYCNMVRLVTKGKSFKANIENFYCKASARALGLKKLDNRIISGQEYFSYGMYNSLGTAKFVQKHVTHINHEIYGVDVMPLEEFEYDPDIVIIICNAYQAMRIVQGYSYNFGVAKNVKFIGNQGLCSECTATPYEMNDLNVSLLCSNTRFAAKWSENELGVGMPYSMFDIIADGIIKTLNSSEPNKRKREIIKQLEEKNIDMNVKLHTSYYKSGR